MATNIYTINEIINDNNKFEKYINFSKTNNILKIKITNPMTLILRINKINNIRSIKLGGEKIIMRYELQILRNNNRDVKTMGIAINIKNKNELLITFNDEELIEQTLIGLWIIMNKNAVYTENIWNNNNTFAESKTIIEHRNIINNNNSEIKISKILSEDSYGRNPVEYYDNISKNDIKELEFFQAELHQKYKETKKRSSKNNHENEELINRVISVLNTKYRNDISEIVNRLIS